MTSFFGGDPTMAFYSASPFYRLEGEQPGDARDRRKAEFEKLKTLGWKQRYFHFKLKDAAAKAKAKADCERHAAHWKEKFGVIFEVGEGCML